MENINEKIKDGSVSIMDLVRDNKKAIFQYYRDGRFTYRTDDGLDFEIPVEDTKDAQFDGEMKAVTLMRWIRKHVELLKSQGQ